MEWLVLDHRARLHPGWGTVWAYVLGLPCGSRGQKSAGNAGDPSSIPGSGRFPWRREWLPTPGFLPGEFHGQRSLVGYSPWGHKESDTTEPLSHFQKHTHTHSLTHMRYILQLH